MFFGMTIYQMLWFFMIYAIVGWIVEVSFHVVTLGKIINRGFLNGPLCPVYGCGVIIVLMVLYGVGQCFGIESDVSKASPILLFVIGIIFATLVELIAGFLLDKLFHTRWWDYSECRFNLNGYICLEFSIIWGLAIAFVLGSIQPTFESFVDWFPHTLGVILMITAYVTLVADVVITVLTVLKLNKELEKMENIQQNILRMSNEMSEFVGNATFKVMDKIEDEKANAEERKGEFYASMIDKKEERDNKKAEYEAKRAELQEKFDHMKTQIMYHKLFGTGRLVNAFPNAKHEKFQKQLEELRQMRAAKKESK